MSKSENFDIGRFERLLQAKGNEVVNRAPKIVADFAHNGEKMMEQAIEDAETATGQRRASAPAKTGSDASHSPGRIDSGLMINQVNSRSESDGTMHTGEFGWTGEQMEYFLLQEDGTASIEGMNALNSAFIAAREQAITDLIDAMKGSI